MQSIDKSLRSIWFGVALAVSASSASPAGQQDAQRAGEKQILDLVTQTNAAVVNNDNATFLRYYAPNAALVLPGRPITYGVATLRKSGFPKGYVLKMQTVKVEVFGDAGYAFGTYTQTSPNARTGALVNTVGKWMSVFKKQPDGSWGAVADTFNVDPSP